MIANGMQLGADYEINRMIMKRTELENKLKNKNLQIESQIELLDEYRNTIKFLEARVLRLDNELSKLRQDAVSGAVCEHKNEVMRQGDGFVYVTCKDCGEEL